MSFFKHLGTKASKFQFHIWIDNVVGVYPSNYSTDEHSTEGIYVILKRRKKSYRTKIALPENGGHVHMNDCIKFTSTLYQKKRRNDEIHLILPKPFTLRVCNGGNSKIRWESNIDISDYASVFGVDAQESFILQFVHKTKQNNNNNNDIPSQITVRLRIKSIWLKNIDNMSQASTDSISRISSSALSDLSDLSYVDNYKLYDTIPSDDHHQLQHKYHSVRFTPLPEEHSIHNSPIKAPKPPTIHPQVSEKTRVSQLQEDTTSESAVTAHNRRSTRSALDSFKESSRVSTDSLTVPSKSRLHSLSFDTNDDEHSFLYRGVRNLSFVQSSPGPIIDGRNLSSPPVTHHNNINNNNIGNSGFLLESELMRMDHKMSKLIEHPTAESQDNEDDIDRMAIDELIELIIHVCIDGMAEMTMDRRLWNNLIPIHSAIMFRCFIHWNVFEENSDKTHLILRGYIDGVTKIIHEQNRNDAEQSYWLLRFTTIIYWIHVYFPQKMIATDVQKPPHFRRYETFEPILSGDDDDDEEDEVEAPVFMNRSNSASNDRCVTQQVQSENATESVDRIPIERTDVDSNKPDAPIYSEDPEEHKSNPESSINLPYWFVERLTALSHICFNNIIDNTLTKLTRIPYEHVFDDNEFGETGSNTMDMIFAVMNSIWFLYDEQVRIYYIFRMQICRQILQYTIYVGLINNLLQNPSFCTIAGGFRLKVIKSMIADWCQSNHVNVDIFSDLTLLLDEVSALLLTCAVASNGEELLSLCPSLNAAQINQILNNYNTEPSNEPLSAEIITPILEIAAAQLPPNTTRVSVQSFDFSRESMQEFDLNTVPLPTISLGDVPTPYNIAQLPEFAFLMSFDGNIVL